METIIPIKSDRIHDLNFSNAQQVLKFLINLDFLNKEIYIDRCLNIIRPDLELYLVN